MALTTEQRQELFAKFQRHQSSSRTLMNVSKVDLKNAVDAIDDWMDDNATSFNNAIPIPARTTMSMKQKLRIFMSILKIRWEVE